jgi:hypothetical protein
MKGRGEDFAKTFDDKLRFQLKFLDYAPVIRMSALTGDRTGKLLEVVERVAAARLRKVTTSEVNKFLESATAAHKPVSKARRDVRILYGLQTAVAPPTFVLFTNVASELHFSYERYLANQLREHFGFEGTPIRLTIRRRERTEQGRGQRAKGKGSPSYLPLPFALCPLPCTQAVPPRRHGSCLSQRAEQAGFITPTAARWRGSSPKRFRTRRRRPK